LISRKNSSKGGENALIHLNQKDWKACFYTPSPKEQYRKTKEYQSIQLKHRGHKNLYLNMPA